MMKKYGLFIKIIELVLIVISVIILVWGFVKGFPAQVADDNGTVDPLLYWAYIMIGLALFAILVVGLFIAIKNNPKILCVTDSSSSESPLCAWYATCSPRATLPSVSPPISPAS